MGSTYILFQLLRSGFILTGAGLLYGLVGVRFDIYWTIALLVYQSSSLMAIIATQLWRVLIGFLPYILAAVIIDIAIVISAPTPIDLWKGHGRPYLIPCRTSHKRFTPKTQSFSYSYLVVGVPVDYKGSANGMISIDNTLVSRPGRHLLLDFLFSGSWYRVRPSDYLQRDHDELSLRGKLDLYLRSQKVDPGEFPYAFLVTAPSFLGYQFNPVSYWYLYSADRTLSAVIFEVNNTFDERRPYLFLRDFTRDSNDKTSDLRDNIQGSQTKDFHVSPFNSRTGHYTIQAVDPLSSDGGRCQGIDVTVTLKSSEGHPTLVARLFSESEVIDPFRLNLSSKLDLVAKLSWVGFATIPRIIKEAFVLMIRRRLRIWNRPDPLVGTLGRTASSAERFLETGFRCSLEHSVRRCKAPLKVNLFSSGLSSDDITTYISPGVTRTNPENTLGIKILTPAFYSRFIEFGDTLDAVDAERKQNGTVWINRPELLPLVFGRTVVPKHDITTLDLLFDRIIGYFRQVYIGRTVTGATERPQTPAPPGESPNMIMASLDAYMILHGDPALKREYQWIVIRQLIADCYFFGQIDALNLLTTLLRVQIAWTVASVLNQIIEYLIER